MTDKEKLDKIMEILIWKGYRFNKHDDIVDFMREYIEEAENNKDVIESTEELLCCDKYDIINVINGVNADFEDIYNIARKYYNKNRENVSDEMLDLLDDIGLIMDISVKYV